MKEEEREVLEAELSSLRHHLREAEAAIAVSERYLEDDHEVCQEKQIEKKSQLRCFSRESPDIRLQSAP